MASNEQDGAREAEIARRACRERGLDEDDAPIVQQMMRRPESCWAPCCADNCDPCADDYAAAARLGQRLLEAERLTRPRPESRA